MQLTTNVVIFLFQNCKGRIKLSSAEIIKTSRSWRGTKQSHAQSSGLTNWLEIASPSYARLAMTNSFK